MGNEDSGRWPSPDAKMTVEDCDYIDILVWSRGRQMRPGCCYTGGWKWPRSRPKELLDSTGRVINCIHYSIELLCDSFVRMCYKDLRSGRFYDYNVDLVSHASELRWPALVVHLPWIGGARLPASRPQAVSGAGIENLRMSTLCRALLHQPAPGERDPSPVQSAGDPGGLGWERRDAGPVSS